MSREGVPERLGLREGIAEHGVGAVPALGLHVKGAEFEQGKSLEADVIARPKVRPSLLVETIGLIVRTKVAQTFRREEGRLGISLGAGVDERPAPTRESRDPFERVPCKFCVQGLLQEKIGPEGVHTSLQF